jgi:hypothetical protein
MLNNILIVHFKTDLYLKILDRPSRISNKLFLNFFKTISKNFVVLDFFFVKKKLKRFEKKINFYKKRDQNRKKVISWLQ